MNKFIELTVIYCINSQFIEVKRLINTKYIKSIGSANKDLTVMVPGQNAIINMSNGIYKVRETYEEIKKMLCE